MALRALWRFPARMRVFLLIRQGDKLHDRHPLPELSYSKAVECAEVYLPAGDELRAIALYKLARELSNQDRFDEALKFARDASASAEKVALWHYIDLDACRVLAGQAWTEALAGLWRESIATLDRVLDRLEEAKYAYGLRIHALLDRGNMLLCLEQPQEALADLLAALDDIDAFEDRSNPRRGALLASAGLAHQVLGNAPEAERFFGQSMTALAATSDQDPASKRGDALLRHGMTLSAAGRYENALRVYELGEQVFAAAKIATNRAVALSNIGTMHRRRGALEEAETCYREGLHIRRMWAPNPAREGVLLSNLADCLVRQGRLEESERLVSEAMERLAPSGSRKIGYAHGTLAAVRAAQGRDQEADALFRESMQRKQPIPIEGWLGSAECMDEHAAVLHRLGSPEDAAGARDQARKIRERLHVS